jgi:hypothetical protein
MSIATAYERPATARAVTRVFRQAAQHHLEYGLQWYGTANDVAASVARATDHPIEVAVGVIAATSPRMGWGPNVKLAHRILETGDTSRGYLSNGLRSAQRMLDGADPLEVLRSRKTSNFYRAIISRGADGIVVDRHAMDIAHATRVEGDRPSPTDKQYDAIAETYRRAASALKSEHPGITPAQVQAVTWLAWRNRFWSAGAFDLRGDLALELEGVS